MNQNKFKNLKIKDIILFVSLLIITLYIPLSITIYSTNWYEFNYYLQDTYKNPEEKQITLNATNNLIEFFLYQNKLNNLWNPKEHIHMSEVRNIYTTLAILTFLSLINIILLYNKKKVLKYSKINIWTISILLGTSILIIPFFNFFWNYIFHPILFRNSFWIYTKYDISYYLFPQIFFIRSILFITIISIIINYIIYKKLKLKQ